MNKFNFSILFLMFGTITLLGSCRKITEYGSAENLCAIPDSIRIFPDSCSQRFLRWCETSSLRATNGDTLIQTSNGECVHLDRSAIPFIFKVYKVRNSDTNIEKLIRYYTLKSKKIIKSDDCTSMGKWSMEEDIVWYKLDTFYSNAISDNLIPNFIGEYDVGCPWYDASTESGLKDSYKFYVIKSGSDFILPNGEFIYRWWLPAYLQHGYLSGVAISKEIEYVIYFAIAW